MPDTNTPSPFATATDPPHTARGVVGQFAIAAILGASLMIALAFGLTGLHAPAIALAVAGYGFGITLAMTLLRRGFPHETLGLCNVVTLIRLALVASLLAPLLYHSTPPWGVFAIAATALALDGVDGWLARHAHRTTSFGARFDMEVDAASGLIIALNAWASGAVGAYVVLIGLPRYVFVAASWVLPWLGRPVPERFSRKAVCVLQIAALIALQIPLFPADLGPALVALVAASLLWSFGRDVAWLWRHRA